MGRRLGTVEVIVYLDTQVVIFLTTGNVRRLSTDARRVLQRAEPLASPMVLVELEILHELQRIKPSARDIERKLKHEIGLRVCDLPFIQVAEVARDEGWTRDPFDRIIVAQAKANGFATLISSDEIIAKNYPRTVW